MPSFVRLLLGKGGRRAYGYTDLVVKSDSAFHTTEILRTFGAHGLRGSKFAYLDKVRYKLDEHFAEYIFFLAALIEIKKQSRSMSLSFLFLGGAMLWGWLAWSFIG